MKSSMIPGNGDQVMIVAAEASSSLYAQRLLEFWKKQGVQVSAFGVGSREMEAIGFERLGRSEEMAVVGLQEVIAHFPLIKKTFYDLLEQARVRKPKFALLLDYPDFNLRLAKRLKSQGVTVIYYISPQVWAWRRGRVKLIREVVDHMLVLFPFEEKFYRENKVTADFVGHPLLDEIDESLLQEKTRSEMRSRYGLKDQDLVLGLMPGSRNSEIRHHLSAQLAAAKDLMKRHPHVKPVLLVAPSLPREVFQEALSLTDLAVLIVKDEPMRMIAITDLILCASGTATLTVGLMEKPMVIMYRMNSLSAFFAKLLVRHVKHFGLVNLVMDERVVPELFQEQAEPHLMADALDRFVSDPALMNATKLKLQGVKVKLGASGATSRVAGVLKTYLRSV